MIIETTQEEVNIILTGLAELPSKISFNLIIKIQKLILEEQNLSKNVEKILQK